MASYVCVECGTVYPVPTTGYTCNNQDCPGNGVTGMIIINKRTDAANVNTKKPIKQPLVVPITPAAVVPDIKPTAVDPVIHGRKINYKKTLLIGGLILLALVAGWFANELISKKNNTTSSVSQTDLSNLEMDTTKAVNNTGVLDLVSPGGMPYQVYRGTDTQRIYPGNTIKIRLIQKLNDSVLFSSDGNLPTYIPVSGIIQPYDITEIWATVMAGDSIVATQLVDTFINRSPGSIPPEFKRGDRIITSIRILAVFRSDAAATADKERLEAALLAKEIMVIEKYLAANNITAERTPSGAFIEIIEPGTGDLAAPGKYVSVNYTGSTFSGKIFDSSTDSAFQHMYPLSFIAGTNKMIKGFEEAILMMRPGAVARVYIPAMLAYGAAGHPKTIVKAYENLVFDISLLDVKDQAP